jgi:DNA-binding PadR family transcriptional regulator
MGYPGLLIQPRDVKWLTYLAHGPARFAEAAQFYTDQLEGLPIHPRQIYRRLKELERAKFIKKHVYKNVEKGTCFYLGENGVVELMSRFGYEPSHLRTRPVPPKHLVHEIILSSVIRKIYQDAESRRLYKVLFAYDDTVMKKESKYKKNKVYPDLKMRIEPMVGSTRDFLFEIDGLNLRKDRFVKKLAGLTEALFVVTMSTPRLELLFRYTEIANRRPPEIFITSHKTFLSDGLTGTKWLHFPTKKFKHFRF